MKRLLPFLLAFVLLFGSAAAAAPPADAAAGARWLASRQEQEGDLPSYTGSGVGELIMALLAGGQTGAPVDRALSYVRTHGSKAASKPAYAARFVMGLVAAGEDPRSFGGVDYAGRITLGSTGAYEENVYANAIAMLGVRAAGRAVPGSAVAYMRAQQCPSNGGFAWKAGCAGTPDVDTTSSSVSALVAAGVPKTDTVIARARSFLADAQNGDGGFGLEGGSPTNANSTGLAMSAIAALGERPDSPPWKRSNGATPRSALGKLRDASGGFRYLATSREPGDYATVQAVLGLAGVPYPMAEVDRTQVVPKATAAPTDAPRTRSGAAAPRPRPAVVARATTGASPRVTGTPDATGGGTNRAGVVVRSRDGGLDEYCVAFGEETITGVDLLERSGADAEMQTSKLGTSVCRIDGTGCASGDCFCDYPTFWGYWTFDDAKKEWTFAQAGAMERVVRDGSVDAWVWGKDGKPAPPEPSLDEICSAAPSPSARVAASATAPVEEGSSAGPAIAGFAALVGLLGAGAGVAVWRRNRVI